MQPLPPILGNSQLSNEVVEVIELLDDETIDVEEYLIDVHTLMHVAVTACYVPAGRSDDCSRCL